MDDWAAHVEGWEMDEWMMVGCMWKKRKRVRKVKFTVGYEAARVSVMIAPEADQVKISIWPGVSTRM
jgi:hypothetical protein